MGNIYKLPQSIQFIQITIFTMEGNIRNGSQPKETKPVRQNSQHQKDAVPEKRPDWYADLDEQQINMFKMVGEFCISPQNQQH